MTDKPESPIDQAIDAAVERAVEKRVVPLIEGLKLATPADIATPEPKPETFVSMGDMCDRCGVNRTTILRRERAGKLPKRRKFPDGRVGWLGSEIDAWFASAKHEERDAVLNAERAARITRH